MEPPTLMSDDSKVSKTFSRDHEDGVNFANTILDELDSCDKQKTVVLLNKTKVFYEEVLERHFQHEEQTLFAPLFKHHRVHLELASRLLREHGQMRLLVKTMDLENAEQSLRKFAELLIAHTRTEEQSLLLDIYDLFTAEEMMAIKEFTPINIT